VIIFFLVAGFAGFTGFGGLARLSANWLNRPTGKTFLK
jgi:uncharacterized membrane protein YtjA (UPF0391 family)